MAGEGSPFDKYVKYRQLRLATPSEQDTIRREDQYRAQDRAEKQFQDLPVGRRFAASARNVASGIPIAGNLVDRDNPDLQLLQQARPRRSALTRGIGTAAAYTGLGGVAPGLFSTIPRAAISSGVLEASDAAMQGRNPAIAGLMGAASAVPGGVLGKLATPRTNTTAQATWKHRFDTRDRRIAELNSELTDVNVGALRTATEGTDAASRAAQNVGAEHAMATAQLHDIFRPAPRLNRIPETSVDRIEQMARWGLAGAAGGHLLGNPIVGALAGAVIPEATRRVTRGVNRGIDALNEGILSTPAGRSAGDVIFKYLNNQVLSDKDRALLHALGAGATTETLQSMPQPNMPAIPRLGN